MEENEAHALKNSRCVSIHLKKSARAFDARAASRRGVSLTRIRTDQPAARKSSAPLDATKPSLTLFSLGSLMWSMPRTCDGQMTSPVTSWYSRLSTGYEPCSTPRMRAAAPPLAPPLPLVSTPLRKFATRLQTHSTP